jgi:hypothetical protein
LLLIICDIDPWVPPQFVLHPSIYYSKVANSNYSQSSGLTPPLLLLLLVTEPLDPTSIIQFTFMFNIIQEVPEKRGFYGFYREYFQKTKEVVA